MAIPCSDDSSLTHLKVGFKIKKLRYRVLLTRNFEVMIINPRAMHNFAKALMVQNKSDAIDAKIIAQFIERMGFSAWTPPEKEVFDLRSCGRFLTHLSEQRTIAKNQLHSYSATESMSEVVIEELELTIKQINKQIERVESHVIDIIENSEQLAQQYELLTGMKGVSTKTALKVLGEVGVLSTDMKGNQWVAHAGLYPRTLQSGTSLNKSIGIGKSGNPYIRGALYMAALSASRHDPYIKGYYQHLINDNGLKKIQAICAVMRKMLLAMHGMLKNNQPFDNERFYKLPAQ